MRGPLVSLVFAFVVLASQSSVYAQSRSVKDCDGVLVPSVTQTNDDYSRMQDYLFYNAAREYDRLSKLTKESRDAEASYKVAQAEYHEAKSASDFEERMKSRINNERSKVQESTSSSNYRRRLEPAQLRAWAECVRAVTSGGALFIVAEDVNASAFPLAISWYPAKGQTEGKLTLQLANATVDGKTERTSWLKGSGDIAFIVKPDGSNNPVVITGEILGSIDTSSIPTRYPTPSKAPVTCLSTEQVKRHSVDDNYSKAPVNYAPCFSHKGSTGSNPNIDAWYRINILEKGKLLVHLRGEPNDFQLQIRDERGQELARPSPKIAKSQSLEYTVAKPGEYLIRPQPNSGPSDYEIQVSFVPAR